MTIFELVKRALDDLYQEATASYGAKVDEVIGQRLAYLSQSYGQLNEAERKPIDYRDPATRFAYVYKYVAAHGDYVVQVLEHLRIEAGGHIFDKENIRVTCLGGGPGSDIIAVLKYLDDYKKQEPVKKVTCYLLDKEQAWADTWTELDDSLQVAVTLHANFQPLDVTQPTSWVSQQKFLKADLFTLSYFVSEVSALDTDGSVSDFLATLFEKAQPGALFLYDDNGSDAFNSYFDAQWQKAGLECLISQNNSKITPRYSEQASELAAYRTKFNNHSPKIQAWLSYRVLRKPT